PGAEVLGAELTDDVPCLEERPGLAGRSEPAVQVVERQVERGAGAFERVVGAELLGEDRFGVGGPAHGRPVYTPRPRSATTLRSVERFGFVGLPNAGKSSL